MRLYAKSCESMSEVASDSVQLAVTSLPDVFKHVAIEGNASWLLLYNRSYLIDRGLPFFAPMANELARVLKEDGAFVLNIGCVAQQDGLSGFGALLPLTYAEYVMMRSPLRLLYDIIIIQQPNAEGEIVGLDWEKERGVVTMQQHLLVFAKSEKVKMNGPAPSTTAWTYIAKASKPDGFPTAFPLSVVHQLLKVFSDEGDLVLDPCAGRGTLWAMAQQMGRDCVMYETDPKCIAFMRSTYRNC